MMTPVTTAPIIAGTRRAVVVGGGPGGLMAAEVLATAGFSVTVVEQMPSVGRKFLLAGRGGLNITHSEPLARLLDRYGPAGAQLSPAIQAFTPNDLRDWCDGLGEATIIGSSGKVFPVSFRATPLLRAWLKRLTGAGVEFRVRTRWLGWGADESGMSDPRRLRFASRDGGEFNLDCDVAVFALGGASWPRVGSDGSWVDAFRAVGVTVTELQPANCGVRVAWSAPFVERWNGEPLKNIALGVGERWVRGDAIATRSGIEGGPVYAHGAAIREAIRTAGAATVHLDLHPDLTLAGVAARLAKRRSKDSLSNTLRRTLGLAPVSIALLREATGNDVATADQTRLATLVKRLPLHVLGMMPIERAISTAGGVGFDAVDDGFMLHALPGTFVIGEMLDWEAPTGGYLLQATFSTAVAAARAAAAYVGETTTSDH